MLPKVCCGQFMGEICVGSPSLLPQQLLAHTDGMGGWSTLGGAPWSFHKFLDSDYRESCRLRRNLIKIYSGNQDSWKAQQCGKKYWLDGLD
jgi:hypothetical protein